MRLYIDKDSRQFIKSPDQWNRRPALAFKRRDRESIEVCFIENTSVIDLGGEASGILGIKWEGDYNSDYLAASLFWQRLGSGRAAYYQFLLDLDTAELSAAFNSAKEPASISCMLEVQWTIGQSTSSSLTIPILIHNDVIRGDEGLPSSATPDKRATQQEAEAGIENSKWMTPLRTNQALAALAKKAGIEVT
jgi:hypothetical protein